MRAAIFLSCVFLLISSTCFAQAYKCKVDGKMTYQGTPCANDGEKVNLSGAGQANAESAGPSYFKKEGARIDHQEKVDGAINNGRIFVGMTKDQVLQSWGKPTKINRTIVSSSASEQWIYERGNIGDTQYVYLTNGVVRSMQSPEKPE